MLRHMGRLCTMLLAAHVNISTLLKINKANPAKIAKPTTIFHINTPK